MAGFGYWYFKGLFAGDYDCRGKNTGVVRLFGQIDTLGTDDGSTVSGPGIVEQIDKLDKDKTVVIRLISNLAKNPKTLYC